MLLTLNRFDQELEHTLRGYVRDAELFKDHAGRGLL
jgi:hypothetical protein